jgi:hypothetical protein
MTPLEEDFSFVVASVGEAAGERSRRRVFPVSPRLQRACNAPHKATGPRLYRGPVVEAPGIDSNWTERSEVQ